MKTVRIILISFVVLIAIYILGPQPPRPRLDKTLPKIEGSIENYVLTKESKERLREGNEAKIIWANDSLKSATDYVLLYLPGFSATRKEGFPINEQFSAQFGCNAYLARLASHGLITEDPLIDMTPDRLYDSAKEALVIAENLGKKVIIMSCSTGGTLSLKLAADFPEKITGLILYSPNVSLKNKTAKMISKPWGLQIARLNLGSDFRVTDDDPNGDVCKYWYCRYRAEGLVYLQQLIDVTMNKSLFAKVTCPVFVGYYYKDEANQDMTVEVKSIKEMYSQLGTPENKKKAVAFPDAKAHVISSDLFSKSVEQVQLETWKFAQEVLGMKLK